MSNPHELVHVVGKNGDEHVVGRAWLDRWPDDFTEVPSDSKTPEPVQAKDTPTSPVAKPVKEHN